MPLLRQSCVSDLCLAACLADDHDFGANNQGDEYPCPLASQNEFVAHFSLPASDPRHPAQGGDDSDDAAADEDDVDVEDVDEDDDEDAGAGAGAAYC